MSAVDTVDPSCLAASAALAAGDTAAMAAHAKTCEACAFVMSLVPDLHITVDTTGIGPAFQAVVEQAIATREPLLGRYRIDGVIARGGQGIVCRATDRELGAVALKFVRCRPASQDERIPEGRVAARLGGEGVCRIHNIERHGDIRLVVMELVDGECLEDALPRLTPARRMAIFRSICEAVIRIHRENILHLDLKPRNIVLRSGDIPVVTDFGVAVSLEDDGTARPLGHTRHFAPPEQLAGERVDRRADIHALGRILEVLVPSPPAHVRRVITRATSADLTIRHADVAAVLADLDRPARVRRSLVRASALGIVTLVVVGGTAALARGVTSRAAPGPDRVVDFDFVETYGRKDFQGASAYLAGAHITFTTSAGTDLVIGNTLAFYEGKALIPVSAPNVLTQIGSNDPVHFTLTFDRPLARVAFRRPALIPATASGITFPQWSASARDAQGTEVARDGEAAFGSYTHVPVKLVALEGDCIKSIRFDSNNGHFAAVSAIVIDDLALTYADDDDC